MLLDAYKTIDELVQRDRQAWKDFDRFVFDNLELMDRNGFVTTISGKPIGFSTWDPRNLPQSVEIGHNCIIREFQGKGFGNYQLKETMVQIMARNPQRIFVKTGANQFFLPARRMYESSGFVIISKTKHDDLIVPETVDYTFET